MLVPQAASVVQQGPTRVCHIETADSLAIRQVLLEHEPVSATAISKRYLHAGRSKRSGARCTHGSFSALDRRVNAVTGFDPATKLLEPLHEIWRQASVCKKTVSFLSFLYDFPEPVLVK